MDNQSERSAKETNSEAVNFSPRDVQKPKMFWNNDHFVVISETLQILFDTEQFCDITLISSDNKCKIRAHKNILASVSKYFLAMFGGSLSEAEKDEIKLNQLDGRSLKAIIDFIYKGIIELTLDSVESVIVGAHVWELNALEKICSDYMKENIDVSNCLEISYFAHLHNFDDLYKAAMKCACEKFVALRKEDEFLSLDLKRLCELISRDDLQMASEGEVFHAIMAWVNHQRDDRVQFLKKLLSCVRFPFLSPAFIAEFIEKECETLDTLRIVSKTFSWHALPKKREIVFSHKQHQIRSVKDVIVAISGLENSNSGLSVAIFLSTFNEWAYTKWPSPPRPRTKVLSAVVGERLLIAGGFEKEYKSGRVECMNLKTLLWTVFPSLPECPGKLISVNGAVYAFGRKMYKLSEPFEKWATINYPEPHNETINCCATHKDFIYFPFKGSFRTYNTVSGTFDTTRIQRKSVPDPYRRHMETRELVGIAIIQRSNSAHLVEITRANLNSEAHIHDLNSFACNSKLLSVDYKTFKSHGSDLLVLEESQIYKYNVFDDELSALPILTNSLMPCIDVMITSKNIMA